MNNEQLLEILIPIYTAKSQLKSMFCMRMLEFSERSIQYKIASQIEKELNLFGFALAAYKQHNTMKWAWRALNAFIDLKEALVLAKEKWLSKRSKSPQERRTEKQKFMKCRRDFMVAMKPLVVHWRDVACEEGESNEDS